MSTVTDLLRAYPRVVAALRDVVDAHLTNYATADDAVSRLHDAVTAAEQLLAEYQPGNGDVARDTPEDKEPAGMDEPADQPPQPAKKRTAKKRAAKKSTAKAARRPRPSPQGEAAGPAAATKWCNDCGAHRPVAEFGRNKSTGDGLATYCRDHQRARNRTSKAKSRAREGSDSGDKEGAPVAPVDVAPRPAVPRPVRMHGQRPVVVKNKGGTSGAELPLPGEPTFTIRLVCTRCNLDATTTHPPADDQAAIAETWRRVEQALHSPPCPGELTATVAAVDNTGPAGAAPVPHRKTSSGSAVLL